MPKEPPIEPTVVVLEPVPVHWGYETSWPTEPAGGTAADATGEPTPMTRSDVRTTSARGKRVRVLATI